MAHSRTRALRKRIVESDWRWYLFAAVLTLAVMALALSGAVAGKPN